MSRVFDVIQGMCKEKGMHISTLEQAAGIGNGTIRAWRDGVPRFSTLEKVAAALDMPVTELVDLIIKAKEA